MNKKVVNIACVVLLLLGIFAWSRELAGSPGVSNLSEYAPWGLYIALFLFFEALCAGTLFIAAVGGNNLPRLKMTVIGTVSGICAGIAILPDLGSPLTAWRLLFAPNISSPMILDVWFLGLSVVLGILLIIGLTGAKDSLIRPASIALSIVSVLLPIGTAWLFTTLPGKIGWSSSLEIGVFIAQAALAGLCVLLIMQRAAAKHTTNNLAKLVLGFLLINLALIIGEIGQAFYSSGIEALPAKALLGGSLATVFWCQVIIGVIIPAILLGMNKSPLAAGTLSLIGVVLSKYLFVVKGNIYPYLNLGEDMMIPGLGVKVNGFQTASYAPSGYEWLVGLGVLALGVLLINLVLPRVTNKTGVISQEMNNMTL